MSPFSPGMPVAPSRPSRPSLPGKPWPPCRPGVPGMPGCPEHSPGILLSSICKDLVMSPRRKRRKRCFILSWRGWKGAEKDHSSGDDSEEGWECSAGSVGGSAGDTPPLLFPLPFGLLPSVRPRCCLHLPQHPHGPCAIHHPAAPGQLRMAVGCGFRARGCGSAFVRVAGGSLGWALPHHAQPWGNGQRDLGL